MKRKSVFLAALAVALVLSAGIETAWGYFTTYAEAKGGLTIELGSRREFNETFDSWTKHLTITNDAGSSEDIYVRAQVFGPEEYYLGREAVHLNYVIGGTNWSSGGDGYWYYSKTVPPGGAAEVLDVRIVGAPYSEDDPNYPKLREGDAFNVVVVYESVPVAYDAATGEPVGVHGVDWSKKLDTGESDVEVRP